MENASFDVIIIGAGVSGSFMALALTRAGMRCLLLEAGHNYTAQTFPRNELDANSRLYWSGGVELNQTADLALLRPKCVGGGSVVNQALVDRFDAVAFDSWQEVSGVSFFNRSAMDSWYTLAESELEMREIDRKYWNRNADIFQSGFKKLGYSCAPLRRAQKDCHHEEGRDCIECLSGCRIESKQSMPWTTLKKAAETGRFTLISDFEVREVIESQGTVVVSGIYRQGRQQKFKCGKAVMASGAIGNSLILLKSGYEKKIPALGSGFYTHPQFMNFGLYEEPVFAHRGPFQALKSDEPKFRQAGFKLENVFAGPVGVAMLLPQRGTVHSQTMTKIPYMACIEVAVRDTQGGRIRLKPGKDLAPIVQKELCTEDLERRKRGFAVLNEIFMNTGAKQVIEGQFGIGLHLMGGCAMGVDGARSCVTPDFRLQGSSAIFVADSSIFPNAPGMNPSLTIMALALKAAVEVQK